MTVREIEEIKSIIERKNKEYIEASTRLEFTLKELDERFGCKTYEEGMEKLKGLEEELKKDNIALESLAKKIKEAVDLGECA